MCIISDLIEEISTLRKELKSNSPGRISETLDRIDSALDDIVLNRDLKKQIKEKQNTIDRLLVDLKKCEKREEEHAKLNRRKQVEELCDSSKYGWWSQKRGMYVDINGNPLPRDEDDKENNPSDGNTEYSGTATMPSPTEDNLRF